MQNLIKIEREEFIDRLRSVAEEEFARECIHSSSFCGDIIYEAAHTTATQIAEEHPMETYAYLVKDEPLNNTVNLGVDGEREIQLGTTTYKLHDSYKDFETANDLINEIISSVAVRIVAKFIHEQLVEGDWNGIEKVQVDVSKKVDVGDETKEVTGKETQYEINQEFIQNNYDF
jgi:hypothetical protein